MFRLNKSLLEHKRRGQFLVGEARRRAAGLTVGRSLAVVTCPLLALLVLFAVTALRMSSSL